MLKLPCLTKEDLQIYQGKKVVFYDMLYHHKKMIALFQELNIEMIACCAENISTENFLALKLKGITLLKQKDLYVFLKEHDNIIMQGNDSSWGIKAEIEAIARALDVPISPISIGKLMSNFSSYSVFKTLKSPIKSMVIEAYWHHLCRQKTNASWNRFKKTAPNAPIILCLPPKTADVTLVRTFGKTLNDSTRNASTFKFQNVWHRPRFINRTECEKKFGTLKLIVALREPIAQNLSAFYQILTSTKISYDWVYGAIQNKSKTERAKLIETHENLSMHHGNDVQMLWDAYLKRYFPLENKPCVSVTPSTIQQFMLELQENIIDITQYPFNKEEGYTIIKEGNTEVFVYQLEKLNSIVPELSEWVGLSFNKLEQGNAAEDKWIAESYKQAQKEIEITQEYFDKCFDEPYVKHCYSEADIERFKDRWRPHIKK